jgi:hypothetical protein
MRRLETTELGRSRCGHKERRLRGIYYQLDFHSASLARGAAAQLPQREALLDACAKQLFEAQEDNGVPAQGEEWS